MCLGDCGLQSSRQQLLRLLGPPAFGCMEVRGFPKDFSLDMHKITFNYKFNVEEYNQVIRMCDMYDPPWCASDVRIQVGALTELRGERCHAGKADDCEVHISIPSTCHL